MRIATLVSPAIAAALTVAAASGVAFAHETGFAEIHDMRREGSKLCMTDHWHYGAGAPKPTRKAAELDAAQAWAGFTSFEYGSTWANVALAAGKTYECSSGPSGITCNLSARPCKALTRKR